jgi:hypothetical protein
MIKTIFVLLAAIGLTCAGKSAQGNVFYKLSPTATYLRTSREGPSPNSPLNLTQLGILPGMTLRIATVGEFTIDCGEVNYRNTATAVFSSSTTVLSSDNQYRLSGAIDAGDDIVTWVTMYDGLTTDIPEDFYVGPEGVDVVVPEGALYLFAAGRDDWYSDNLDRDNDFGINIDIIAVPESSSMFALASGLGCFGLFMRRRWK